MNFFTKVLSRFASTPRLQPTVSFEVPPESNVTRLRIEETRTTLRKHIADALEGLDVVPGFSYPLVELLK